MLEVHNATMHQPPEDKKEKKETSRCRIEGDKIFYTGYHKVKSGAYVCNYCSFKSFVRTTVSSHSTRKHSSLIQANTKPTTSNDEEEKKAHLVEVGSGTELKAEAIDIDDEDFWPMDVIEEVEDDTGPEPPPQKSLQPARICPYCPFETTKTSTFHSHVKRRHRDDWLKSVARKVAALQPDVEDTKAAMRCDECPYRCAKLEDMQMHMIEKHGYETLEMDILNEEYGKEGEATVEEYEITNEGEIVYAQDENIEIVDSMDAPALEEEVIEEEVAMEEEEQQETTTRARKSRKCPYCPFESWINSTLNSHITRRHKGQSARRRGKDADELSGRRQPNAQMYTGYACHYCTFVAATVASIKNHSTRQHQGLKQPIKEVPVNEYDCHLCEHKSKHRRNMQLHIKKCHTTQANDEGMFSCHACSYETLSRMGLQRHISIKHNSSRKDIGFKLVKGACYECNECEFKCLNRKTMDWHKRQHVARPNAEDDGNSYFCNDCDFSTWTKGQLYMHIRRKHKDNEGSTKDTEAEQLEQVYGCQQCEYTTKNKHAMKVHVIRKHTNEYNHECEICGKKYKVKADLTNHIRFQHREQPIICDVCGKTCRNSNLLYLHQKFAHYKPEFECPICHRRMVSQANLDDHIIKQHEQREDAVCEECGKTFTRQARLKVHMRIHTGVKPYTCKVCLKAFARRNGLRQHLLIHTGQRPYICDICGKSFTQKTGLISHRKSHPGSHPPLPRVTIDHVLSELLNEEN